uniref:Uncharacterized protein n=1 Tax=Anopheles maculatus TaxID=74869 RepID=A0A182T3N8_9DIPT
MSNVAPQQYQQQRSRNGTNSDYYGSTNATQQQQHGGGNYSYTNYGSSSSQHMAYWNAGQSAGYANNQPGHYFTRGATQAASSTAPYPRSNWYSKSQERQQTCYVQNPTPVATGNHSNMKRGYSNDTALHDITNCTNAPKRRKFNTHAAQVIPKGLHKNATIAQIPSPSSIDQTNKVRIESIFRHVELLAQSYWQTNKCPATTVLKPTTVDAFEGGMPASH